MIFIPRSPWVAKRIEWVRGYIKVPGNNIISHVILLRYPFETFFISYKIKNPPRLRKSYAGQAGQRATASERSSGRSEDGTEMKIFSFCTLRINFGIGSYYKKFFWFPYTEFALSKRLFLFSVRPDRRPVGPSWRVNNSRNKFLLNFSLEFNLQLACSTRFDQAERIK